MVLNEQPWRAGFFRDDPRFEPIAPYASRFAGWRDWPSVDDFNVQLRDRLDPLLCKLMEPRPHRTRRKTRMAPEASYDGRIVLDRVISTRERNWHDYLNLLCWAAFPSAKAALHARQLAAKRRHGAAPHRSALSDVLTRLDEGGVLVLGPSVSVDGSGVWHEADLRRIGARVWIFGHAIYEHLVRGQRGLRGAAIRGPEVAGDALDEWLASYCVGVRTSAGGPSVWID